MNAILFRRDGRILSEMEAQFFLVDYEGAVYHHNPDNHKLTYEPDIEALVRREILEEIG